MLITYEKGLSDRGNSHIEATSYCYMIYEADLGYGLDESILISLVIGNIMIERTKRIFVGQSKLFEKSAKESLNKHDELDLTQEERNEVVRFAKQLLEKLPSLEIEFDSKAK